MKSTAEYPFRFFVWYLDDEINKDLEQFKKEASNYTDIIDYDEKKHIFKIRNIYGIEGCKEMYNTFESCIQEKIKTEVKCTQEYIEMGLEKRLANKDEVKEYANFLQIKLNHLENHTSFREFSFLSQYFIPIRDLLKQFSQQKQNKERFATPFFSFTLNADDDVQRENTLTKLFESLTENPPMINCAKEDFFNAFSGEPIENKIQWLATSIRNKKTSKTALLYLLDELIDEGFLPKSVLYDLYKYIRYIFVDAEGNELKNLKQTRQNMSDKPDYWERINSLISTL